MKKRKTAAERRLETEVSILKVGRDNLARERDEAKAELENERRNHEAVMEHEKREAQMDHELIIRLRTTIETIMPEYEQLKRASLRASGMAWEDIERTLAAGPRMGNDIRETRGNLRDAIGGCNCSDCRMRRGF